MRFRCPHCGGKGLSFGRKLCLFGGPWPSICSLCGGRVRPHPRIDIITFVPLLPALIAPPVVMCIWPGILPAFSPGTALFVLWFAALLLLWAYIIIVRVWCVPLVRG